MGTKPPPDSASRAKGADDLRSPMEKFRATARVIVSTPRDAVVRAEAEEKKSKTRKASTD